jgi:hypothetical protein
MDVRVKRKFIIYPESFIPSISPHVGAVSYHFEHILEMIGFYSPLVKPPSS